jgi:uncharacterized membrane protein
VVERADRIRREVLALVGLVLLVDVIFIGGYFVAGIARTGTGVKIAFTVMWTLMTLVVVVRTLARIRSIRADDG